MKNSNRKLIAATSLALVAITLMVTATYAWITLSNSPSLTGIQINIGGDNTILIAPNETKVVDGVKIHYPGRFTKSLCVANFKQYDYLNELAGMMPVSTADGVNWYLPGDEPADTHLTLDTYQLDNLLEYANVDAVEAEVDGKQGGYVYLDFWVVSPLPNCRLRISMANEHEGSYVIGLPKVVKDAAGESGYKLDVSDDDAAACVRVGFLVNTDDVTDNRAMNAYMKSSVYREDFTSLKGVYQEPDTALPVDSQYQFTIYEPNGDMHNGNGVSYVMTESGISYRSCADGDYSVTRPIANVNGKPSIGDVSEILTVQHTNRWTGTEGDDTLLEQLFAAALSSMDTADMSEQEITQRFYSKTLAGSHPSYITRARFFRDTKLLYYAGDGIVTPQSGMQHLVDETTTTKAVLVSLEENVPQRIRMFVWLEGQDIDCVREAALERLAVGIEFAGSTQE